MLKKMAFLVAVFATAVTAMTLPPAYSQPQATGPLPEALEKIVTSKQSTIKQALDHLSGSEWAGNYSLQDGPTAGTQFSWAPNVGFIVRWSTCSHGWRETVNYGAAILQNGVLRVTPELSGRGDNVYPIAKDLVPVLWGEQHYLIWSDRLTSFCYAVKNAANAPEVAAFFIKDGDRDKRRNRLASVPVEYRKYLFAKPIIASISDVKPNPKPWIQELTLNAGIYDGVVPEMKFYAYATNNIYLLVEVSDVGEHTSRAYVITSGHRKYSEKEVRPRIGWKLTSRAPKDASNYFPG